MLRRERLGGMYYCRECQDINVVVLTGAGDKAFCSGGDMHVKGHGGYIGTDGVPRLNVLDVQKQIRSLPKPVIAMVNGYAIGGGHVLHVVCDLTIASENAIFGQTGPKVGSFDAGFGSFFEVAKDAKHPFIVHTNRHSVEVLGTSFNISAYPDYKVYTTLAEGRIKVRDPSY